MLGIGRMFGHRGYGQAVSFGYDSVSLGGDGALTSFCHRVLCHAHHTTHTQPKRAPTRPIHSIHAHGPRHTQENKNRKC